LSSHAIPARVTFISHAATDAVRQATFPLDEPLVEGEVEKIAGIGWATPRAQHILSGPERRTKQTAEGLGLKATVAMELVDVNYGVWRGKGIEEIQESDPQGLAAWLTDLEATPHGGDSFAQLIERIAHWMESRTKAAHTLAVTHPAVIRAAVLFVLQGPAQSFWRIDVAPLSRTDLRYDQGRWTIRSVGCALCHLERS
jgi:broad specificity phosphatase PhoE